MKDAQGNIVEEYRYFHRTDRRNGHGICSLTKAACWQNTTCNLCNVPVIRALDLYGNLYKTEEFVVVRSRALEELEGRE